MAYQNLTAVASPQSMLDSIASFLNTNGWTVDRNNLSGSNRTVTVRAPGGSDYIHLFNDANNVLKSRVSIGYNAGNPPSTQPNVSPTDAISNIGTGSYPNVHLFADGTEFHCVVELAIGNEFRHHVAGVITKEGTFDGGTYADGSWRHTDYLGTFPGLNHHSAFCDGPIAVSGSQVVPYNGHMRADVTADARTNFFHWMGSEWQGSTSGFGVVTTAFPSPQTGQGLSVALERADRNNFDGRSMLYTPVFWLRRTGTPVYASAAGYVQMTRFVNMRKLVVGQELNIGSDVWKVFPIFKRSDTIDNTFNGPNLGSWIYGYAIKK